MLVLIGLVTMFGCEKEPDPGRAASDVAATREAVQRSLKSVVTIADGAGLRVATATGEWSVCSPEPQRRLSYRAGGTAAPGDQPAASAIEAVTSALEQEGWTVENAGTDPEPYAVLTRDGLTAKLGVSRRLSTKGQVGISVTGECVTTTAEQDSLLGEEDTVIG